MVRLKVWQWLVLGLPFVSVVGFLLAAAGWQIQHWGISWIWGVFIVLFVGWRWLLVSWLRSPLVEQVEAAVTELTSGTSAEVSTQLVAGLAERSEAAVQQAILAARNDPPFWENWDQFWQRCLELIESVARVYYPQTKHPLLNIYIPQAYTLLRGTVDDLDQWMQKLSPALNQVTIGQAYQAYEVYQKVEPSARRILQAWNWAQWLLNPVAAVARTATQGYSNRANQELLLNLGQVAREAALRNLGRQAIALYSNNRPSVDLPPTDTAPKAETRTLREIFSQVETTETVEQKPVNILLVGRTGAGKSSLINTLFVADQATVDVLPSTEKLQAYHWQTATGEALTLWDAPGYEQSGRSELREQVLDQASRADLLLLVTPALDPALEMDRNFLSEIQAEVENLPTIAIVTQVDRLRPFREWQPPYDWQQGDRPKEQSIREAVSYRAELLSQYCEAILPAVNSDSTTGRPAWGIDALSVALVEKITPAKQFRLARFLRNLDARVIAAAQIIDHYTFQMATTQGLTALLKSPVLSFISTLTTGSPTLAVLLAEKIPVEQLPVVLGKLQMAYDLFNLLTANELEPPTFEFMALWPLLLENSTSPDRNAWAFGHALTEYWTQSLTVDQLRERFRFYLKTAK